MEGNSKSSENPDYKENLFECYICMDKPSNPVATSCGHIYCWKCLQSWTSGKSSLQCPVCKNGLDLNRVIPLYNSSSTHNGPDDRPKVERMPPVKQDARGILRAFGYNGTEGANDNVQLPNANEVKINQVAVLISIFGIFLLMSIFYID